MLRPGPQISDSEFCLYEPRLLPYDPFMDDTSARLKALADHLFTKAKHLSSLRAMDTAFYHFVLFRDLPAEVAGELGNLPQKGRSTLYRVLSPETFKPVASGKNTDPFADVTLVVFEIGFSGEPDDREAKKRLATGIARRLQADAVIVFNAAWSYDLERGVGRGLPPEYVEGARTGVVPADFQEMVRQYAPRAENLVLTLFTPTACIGGKMAAVRRSENGPVRFEDGQWILDPEGLRFGSSLVYPWASAS